eukprot:jgi/Phyca11/132773/e_gw1.227.2.1
MDQRQPSRTSKKRPSEDVYSGGSENDGSDASWEDGSTVSCSSSAATWSVEDLSAAGERTSVSTSGGGCTEVCADLRLHYLTTMAWGCVRTAIIPLTDWL